MPSIGKYLEPGAITRIYDVDVHEVINAVSRRDLPSKMHPDGLIYVDADGLVQAAEKLQWKIKPDPDI